MLIETTTTNNKKNDNNNNNKTLENLRVRQIPATKIIESVKYFQTFLLPYFTCDGLRKFLVRTSILAKVMDQPKISCLGVIILYKKQ